MEKFLAGLLELFYSTLKQSPFHVKFVLGTSPMSLFQKSGKKPKFPSLFWRFLFFKKTFEKEHFKLFLFDPAFVLFVFVCVRKSAKQKHWSKLSFTLFKRCCYLIHQAFFCCECWVLSCLLFCSCKERVQGLGLRVQRERKSRKSGGDGQHSRGGGGGGGGAARS